jgi:hypothetical protein
METGAFQFQSFAEKTIRGKTSHNHFISRQCKPCPAMSIILLKPCKVVCIESWKKWTVIGIKALSKLKSDDKNFLQYKIVKLTMCET